MAAAAKPRQEMRGPASSVVSSFQKIQRQLPNRDRCIIDEHDVVNLMAKPEEVAEKSRSLESGSPLSTMFRSSAPSQRTGRLEQTGRS